jgi:hypothetical protein
MHYLYTVTGNRMLMSRIAHVGDEKYIQHLVKNTEVNILLEGLGIDRKIILK